MVFHRNPANFPVISGNRCNLKCCDISLQNNHGMDLEAIISFFLGRTFPIICTIRTERTAEASTPKLTNRKGKAVYHITSACRYEKSKRQLLAEQLRGLQGIPVNLVKTSSAAQIREKMAVISFYNKYHAFSESMPVTSLQILKVIISESDIPHLRNREGNKLPI